MPKILQRGDHVVGNSEAVRGRGVIRRATVLHQKRQDRPRGHPQRPSADTHQGCEEIKVSSGKKKGNIIDCKDLAEQRIPTPF